MTGIPAPPDIEEHLWARLRDLSLSSGGVRVFAYTSSTNTHGIVEVTSVQVDARAATKESACDLCWLARGEVTALPGAPWDAGIVEAVTDISGPLWQPDDDGAPRYVLRFNVHYRHHH